MWQFPTFSDDYNIDWNCVEKSFSWFSDMKLVPQDKFWHKEGNVQTHTKLVVEALFSLSKFQKLSALDKNILYAAALMHDIEKRSTTKEDFVDGIKRTTSPGHAKKGEYTVRELLYKNIETPFALREHVASLVRYHGLPLWAIEKSNPAREVILASMRLNTEYLSILARADILGRYCDKKEDELLKIDLFEELCSENKCFGNSRDFKTAIGRFKYLSLGKNLPDYEPYDDLKFTVYVMSGLPGSGKDTYICNHFDLPVLSLDRLRLEHSIDPTDKKKAGWLVNRAREEARILLRKKQPFIFNATNITKEIRSKWVSLFLEYGAKVKIIYIEVPYNKLLKQNKNREAQVPVAVIDRLISKLEIPGYDEAHEIAFVV